MKVIGTGLSGLIGGRIVELLGSKYEFIDFSLATGVDITDFNRLKSAFEKHKEARALLHLAAFTDVSKAWEQKDNKEGACYKVNVEGTRNIAHLCSEKDIYFIHVSTDFIFDGERSEVYTERDRPNPIEWYGQTKLWAEQEVKKSDCKNLILRPAFPFKAKPAPKKLEPKPKLDLVRTIIKKFKDKKSLPMFFDQVITPTFIDDIVKVVDYCLQKKPKGVYHAVGSTPLSPYDLASIIAEVFNFDKSLIGKTSLKELKGKKLRPRQEYLAISNEKLTKDFGIKMLSLKEALERIEEQLIHSNDSNH